MNPAQRIADEPVDPADSLLVAYLDGELDDDQRHELEERLVNDAMLRSKMQKLQQSFDMLNELPAPHVEENFARSTVEMVALTTSQALEIQRRQRPWRVAGYALTAAVAALVVLSVGFLTVRSERQREYAQELNDLAVVQNLQGHLSSVPPAFLRALAQDEQWQQHISRGTSLGELITVPAQQQLAEYPPEQRAVTLASFPTDSARRLKANWEGFRQLPEAKQQAVREHFDLLISEQDAPALLATLHEFSVWMDSLPATDAAGIRDAKTVDQFLSRVQQAVVDQWPRWTSGRWTTGEGRSLPHEDIETIVTWLADVAEDRYQRLPEDNPWRLEQERRRRELLERFPHLRQDDEASGSEASSERNDDSGDSSRPLSRPSARLAWGILKRNEQGREAYEDLGEYFDNGKSLPPEIELPEDADRWTWVAAGKRFLTPTEEEYARLTESLSPKAQQFLLGLDLQARKEVLDVWFYYSLKATFSRYRWGVQPKSLEETYESLTNEEREEVDLLPPEDFVRYLRDKQAGSELYRPGHSRGRSDGGRHGPGRRPERQEETEQNDADDRPETPRD